MFQLKCPQVFVLATFILHECRCLIVTLCLYPGIIHVFDVGNFSCFVLQSIGQGLCLIVWAYHILQLNYNHFFTRIVIMKQWMKWAIPWPPNDFDIWMGGLNRGNHHGPLATSPALATWRPLFFWINNPSILFYNFGGLYVYTWFMYTSKIIAKGWGIVMFTHLASWCSLGKTQCSNR